MSPEAASPVTAEALLADLESHLGPSLLESQIERGDLWVRVDREAWQRTAEVLRHEMAMDYFSFLSGIDWMPHTWPNPKVADEEDPSEPETIIEEPAEDGGDGRYETGYAGGQTRFQVFARVHSTSRGQGVMVKADLDDQDPRVDTWSRVYPGADWHERETWEMFGFSFDGHPGLTHLYLPSEFEGHPLRKDFALLSREVKPWPGLVDVEGFPPDPDGDSPPTDSGNGSEEPGEVEG